MTEPRGPAAVDMAYKRTTHKASEITALQIEAAKQLHTTHFGDSGNEVLLAAIIQAMATNYANILSNP